MIAFSNMILFFVLISFMACHHPEKVKPISQVTTVQYETWKCANICDLEINEQFVKDVCLGFYKEEIENRFEPTKVMSESGCKETRVSLINSADNSETITDTKIGICRMSEELQYCVTGSEEKNDLLIWISKLTLVKDVLGRPVKLPVCYPTAIRIGAFAEKKAEPAEGSGSSSNQNA